MAIFGKTLRKLRALFRKDTLDREMSEEMRHHLDLQIEANLASGMKPDEARYAAQRQFGGVEQIKEIARDQRGSGWFEHVLSDLRHAARRLIRAPGFSTTTISTVALGIGACTALFSVVDGVLLKPLDFPHSDEIVFVSESVAGKQSNRLPLAPAVYLDWARENTVFEYFAAAVPRFYNTATKGPAINVSAAGITANAPAVFGARPILGRTFLPAEETPGKDHVAI
ncbi:MAG: permease prefix domain 1-containing protein, partial [Casimicrobiaceae bacterium]